MTPPDAVRVDPLPSGAVRVDPVRVRIDTVRITAASAIEARRLAEALPPAIERAWERSASGARAPGAGRSTAADTVAERIVRLARAELAVRRAEGRTR